MNIKELIEQAEGIKKDSVDFIVHIGGKDGHAHSFCSGNPMAAIVGMTQMMTDMCKRSDIPTFMLFSILADCIKDMEED